MIRHLFKLVWNRRKSFLGIFAGQALIASILMFCMIRLAVSIQEYTSPGLLDTRNTIVFWMADTHEMNPQVQSDIHRNMLAMVENLRQLPFVEGITASYKMTPYLGNKSWSDSLFVDSKKIRTDIIGSDEYGAAVFHPIMEEGQWLTEKTLGDGTFQAVITRQFAEKAGWDRSLGKKIQFKSHTYTVVGVTEGLKQYVFDPSVASVVVPLHTIEGKGEFVVRVKKNAEGAFAGAFNKEMNRLIADYKHAVVLLPVETTKQIRMFSSLIGLALVCIPVVFLSIFAFVGTFGLFSLHRKKHFREFALRIALGSTKKQLLLLVVSESLLVTGFAMIPAFFLSFLAYDCSSILQLASILVAVCVMLLFSFISAWYPAWKVSRINPAEALQYE